MNTITQQLADALRAVLEWADPNCSPGMTRKEAEYAYAVEALAAFDAAQQDTSGTPAGDHTAERWTHYTDGEGDYIAPEHGDVIAEFPKNSGHARRIVACVNACAGIPTDLLDRGHFTLADNELSIYELARVS